MKTRHVENLLLDNLGHEPTSGQRRLIARLAAFMEYRGQDGLFIVNGYAGTGKTTVIGSFVKTMSGLKQKIVLLAPTGRAAKVLAAYSGSQALTIHKKIYRRDDSDEYSGNFVLAPNMHKNTVFIVDEASMIMGSRVSSSTAFGSGNLLDDLVKYVYNGHHCRLMLIGDTAQLPPVGSAVSPALDRNWMVSRYHLTTAMEELKEVVRQEEKSGILFNATALRVLVNSTTTGTPKFTIGGFPDVFRIEGSELEDALNEAYGLFGYGDTLMITRSNKRANQFNQQIRGRIKWQEEELSAGDYMMVVRNNYFWVEDSATIGFIANGDTIEVMKVIDTEEQYGFRFATAMVRLVDYPEEPELEVKLLLDTIMAESPALSDDQSRQLYKAVEADYRDLDNKIKRYNAIKNNVHFNALQVKFAYAVTCHKSQGGQWSCVFIDQGYLTADMIDHEYLRWLYTALTRAVKRVYLVNFSETFFE